MTKQHRNSRIAAIAVALGLLASGSAISAINFGPGGDTFLNGEFQQMSFGAAGSANVLPLLYVGDFAQTDPAKQAVLGSDLAFDYSVVGIGTSAVTVNYSVTNNGFDAFNDLRLLVSARGKGEPGALDTAQAIGFGGVASATDPAQFQILDATGADPIAAMRAANGLNGSIAATCSGAGCLPEMALQWNRASIGAGETWNVSFSLVDDPTLVSGGRYLQSTSLGASGQEFIIGNVALVPEPGTYAMFFAGLGLLALAQGRRRMVG
ncbi:MAG: PEP-CTERM sorting domain-containing protein [Betaproteobacteria bacterium]